MNKNILAVAKFLTNHIEVKDKTISATTLKNFKFNLYYNLTIKLLRTKKIRNHYSNEDYLPSYDVIFDPIDKAVTKSWKDASLPHYNLNYIFDKSIKIHITYNICTYESEFLIWDKNSESDIIFNFNINAQHYIRGVMRPLFSNCKNSNSF